MAGSFFDQAERKAIRDAIISAEKETSGEIRVYIEKKCGESVLYRAAEVFDELGLQKTAQRTGVLIYLAIEDRQFAILGDKGINDKVPANFWNEAKDVMEANFKQGKFTEGLIAGIGIAAQSLIKHFPHKRENINELPDEVVFG